MFVFNEFVSFSGIPKGASTATKGFTCHSSVRGSNLCF